jgi:hypothetical protein
MTPSEIVEQGPRAPEQPKAAATASLPEPRSAQFPPTRDRYSRYLLRGTNDRRVGRFGDAQQSVQAASRRRARAGRPCGKGCAGSRVGNCYT